MDSSKIPDVRWAIFLLTPHAAALSLSIVARVPSIMDSGPIEGFSKSSDPARVRTSRPFSILFVRPYEDYPTHGAQPHADRVWSRRKNDRPERPRRLNDFPPHRELGHTASYLETLPPSNSGCTVLASPMPASLSLSAQRRACCGCGRTKRPSPHPSPRRSAQPTGTCANCATEHG